MTPVSHANVDMCESFYEDVVGAHVEAFDALQRHLLMGGSR